MTADIRAVIDEVAVIPDDDLGYKRGSGLARCTSYGCGAFSGRQCLSAVAQSDSALTWTRKLNPWLCGIVSATHGGQCATR
jgi:hypothetical protein